MKITDYGRELLGFSLAFLIAARRVGEPIGLQKALFALYTSPTQALSLSALSEVTRRDRATIRTHLKRMPSGSIGRDGDLYFLTDVGRAEYVRLIMRFCRSLEQPYLAALSELYRDQDHRALRICALACVWDDMAENTGYSKNYLAGFVAVYLQAQKGGISTAEISKWTTFSYQGTHRVVCELEKEGVIKRSKRKWVPTLKGDLRATSIILSGIKAADIKTLKDMAKLVLFARSLG